MGDLPVILMDPPTQYVSVEMDAPGVSVLWDRAAQAAVIAANPGPTVAARAFAVLHTAIFEAFAAHDAEAVGVATGDALQQPDGTSGSAMLTAMHWAAHTALTDLFPERVAAFDAVIAETGVPADGPAADLGRAAGAAVVALRAEDGANQAGGYADPGGYTPVNPHPGAITDIAAWTPENVPVDPEDANPEQSFLTPHWGRVMPFALEDGAALRPPPPEPVFADGVSGRLDLAARTVTLEGPAGPETLPISRDLMGPVINPAFVAQAETVVRLASDLTDREKLIAEFWEDGPGTAYPPGTMMTLAHFVSARDDHTAAEDAKLFLALANAQLDASIASWDAKLHYDYARPVRVIRELGELGLIGRPGTDEITGETGFVIEAWAGPGRDGATVLADNFVSYQPPGGEVSPPFAEYTSGHSAFSLSAATVLRLFTGSDTFGGRVTFAEGSSRFEPGITPSEPLTLDWATFSEAGAEGGKSRLYGGIHFDDGDWQGRRIGVEAGEAAFRKAMAFASGAAAPDPAEAAAAEVGRLFEAAFGRLAEFDGLNFWAGLRADGMDATALAGAFLSAPEFAARHGPAEALGTAGLIDLFLGNLGIAAEETGLDDRLADAAPAPAVLLAEIANSPEAVAETAYLAALGPVGDDALWFA